MSPEEDSNRPKQDRSSHEDAEIPITVEELERCEREIAAGRFFTTGEVLAHLQQLRRP
jgi:predicted transcriptional regulator